MNIKSKYLQILMYTSITLSIACDKSDTGGSVTPTPTEENIAFTIDIDPGSNVYPALGATQSAIITLTSKMPAAGISVDVVVKKDSDNSIVSSSSYSTLTTPFTSIITSLSPGVLNTVTFTVTSKSKPSNFSLKSFKIARK